MYTWVFDFDGTLADSLPVLVEVLNELSDDLGFEKVTSQEIPALRLLSTQDLLTRFHISRAKIPFYVKAIRKRLAARIQDCEPFTQLIDRLRILHRVGFQLGILTTNSKENVKAFLQAAGIEDLFSFIETSHRLFGKASALSKIIRKYKLNKEEVFYIGDEVRDVQAADTAGIRSIGVAWGFHETEKLKAAGPSYFVTHPGELLTLASQL